MERDQARKLPDGQEGPECPPWLFCRRCVPDPKLRSRWVSQGEGEPFAAVCLPGHLLEEWDGELRSLGRENVSLVDRLNSLLLSFDTHLRIRPDCSALERELQRLAGHARCAVRSAVGTAGRTKVREKMYTIHFKDSYV